MGDDAKLGVGHAEVHEHAATTFGVHDDPLEAREQRSPEPGAAGGAAREQVVRGEHERGGAGAQQEPVELRRGEPLEVQDVGFASEQPAHRERVLDRLHGEPEVRPADPARAGVERLVELIPGGIRA